MKELKNKINAYLDKIRRRFAYVPKVNETVQAMKELGVDLTEGSESNSKEA
tara:strand:+ start:351 stop:503 length:153 start_codon:yes stop_codon:yes gene_type:complete